VNEVTNENKTPHLSYHIHNDLKILYLKMSVRLAGCQ